MEGSATANTICDQIRQRLMHMTGEPASAIIESLLIHGGTYCGKSFRCGAARAVWFVEEGEVKFYREGGMLAENCPVHRLGPEHRRAA